MRTIKSLLSTCCVIFEVMVLKGQFEISVFLFDSQFCFIPCININPAEGLTSLHLMVYVLLVGGEPDIKKTEMHHSLCATEAFYLSRSLYI